MKSPFKIVALVLLPGLAVSCSPSVDLLATRHGPEDLTVIASRNGTELFTATARRQLIGGSNAGGDIARHTIGGRTGGFRTIWEETPDSVRIMGPFRGAGIHAGPAADGGTSIHATCVTPGLWDRMGRVCEFHVAPDGVTKPVRQSRFTPILAGINGMAVADNGQIYVSTFRTIPGLSMFGFGESPTRGDANAVYLFSEDLKTFTQVAHGINGANGLALTDDGRHLLVCAYHDRAILAYPRDPATGSLAERPATIRSNLRFFPDNMKALGDNRFAVAGQRNRFLVAVNFLAAWPTASGGGEIFRWDRGKEAVQVRDLTPILAKDRHAPSVAIPHGEHLYVGHIVSSGVRRLDLNQLEP
jgi:hypothetical protein